MNPYIVTTSGKWPNERYLFTVDRDVVDYRYSLLPIHPIFSPYYSEDNTYTKKSYNPAALNTSLIGLSTNKPLVFTQNNYELNADLTTNLLTFSWNLSAFRKNNYGNILGSIMLQTSENNFFGIVSYPSQLFLYPKSCEVIDNNGIKSYVLQTSTVLLSSDYFQFVDNFYTEKVKQGHSEFISKIPENFISFGSSDITNIVYSLSGNITRGNNEIVKFTNDYNPIFYRKILEKNGCKIRPDTCRLSYFIKYIHYFSNNISIREMGDSYDDFLNSPDTSLITGYILNQNDLDKTLTFQLLQSSINPNLPLEDPLNCVLSSILNFDNGVFIYQNYGTRNLDYPSNIFTPISGIPNTSLSLRYMAELPFISENETLMSSVCSVSSPSSFSITLNSPILVSSHNNSVNWHTKYPPYYYSFKNSYKDTSNIYNYENVNSLNFYLSSTVVRNIKNLTSENFNEHFSEVDLYTSIYSDYDILELPLKDYGHNDYIKFSLENKLNTLIDEKIKVFVLDSNSQTNTEEGIILQEYDIKNSPYIPAISGTYLRIRYNLDSGGTVLTIKPSISTKVGNFDAYWSTTLSTGTDYMVKNSVLPATITVLNQNISSVTLSIAQLTSESSVFGLDLRNSEIIWNIQGENTEDFVIKNVSPVDVGPFSFLNKNERYSFDYTNQIQITGVSNKEFVVTLSSVLYNNINSVTIPPNYFDLYVENKLFINHVEIDKNHKTKLLKLDCKTPILNKLYNLNTSSNLFWKWSYNNIEDITPVTAFIVPPELTISSLEQFFDLNESFNFSVYEENSVSYSNLISSIYVLIETDYTLTEESIPFNISVEAYDLGEFFNGNKTIQINTYPNPVIFATNFLAYYPNFQTVPVLNTGDGLNSLTRPPNGTNYFAFNASNLNLLNTSISSLKWTFETKVSPTSALASPYYINDTITLVPDSSGKYDTIIFKDLNSYFYDENEYKNLEYINGLTSTILTQTDVNLLCSYLSFDRLSALTSTLISISSVENISPLATSIFVTTTSFYTSALFAESEYSFLQEINNLYTYNLYTSSINTEEIIDGELFISEYTMYMVDFWLSARNVLISDNQTNVNTFSSQNIVSNPYLLNFYTTTNKTTSFDYTILEQSVQKEAYFETDVTLKAENVSILNWNNLYDFETKAKVIITSESEFSTYPDIFIIPKHIWVPKWRYNTLGEVWSKRTEKFVTVLDDYDTTYQYFLTGKTYGNRLSCQEFNITVTDSQVTDILETDPVQVVFSVGNQEIVFLDEQTIDSPEQFTLNANDIVINDFKIPCYPDMYTTEGMTVYVTAFNRFFPSSGGITYFGLNELSSNEISVFNYPITAKTHFREYDENDFLIGNYVNSNPRLYDYEPVKFRFYPEVVNFDLDQKRTLRVKQIIEVDPVNSPNLIQYNESSVVYQLSSLYWTVSTVVPATSNEYIDLFVLNVGDAFTPLTIDDYEVGTLVLTASALVSTKITPYTFNNYSSSEYTGERDLWGSVYQIAIGNEDKTEYEILISKVNTITSGTETISTYNALSTPNNYLLTI
jgi:hypothetical protein